MKLKDIAKVFVDKITLGVTIAVASWVLGIITDRSRTQPVINQLQTRQAELKADIKNLEWGVDYFMTDN